VAVGLALVSGIMMAGTLSMVNIVKMQETRQIWFVFSNYGLMIVPFMVYLISSIAETNRLPFDLPEAESELVAGFHVEYSGFRWALYFLAEYVNMLVVSAVAVTLFWGGWLRPFPNVAWLEIPLKLRLAGPAVRRLRPAVRPHGVARGGSLAADHHAGRRGGRDGLRAPVHLSAGQLDGDRRLLVPAEDRGHHLHFHLAARNLSALPLRPVDEHRLEVYDPHRHGRDPGERRGGDAVRQVRSA
jgi:hypothetical protein